MIENSSPSEGASVALTNALGTADAEDIRPVIFVVNATVVKSNAGPDEAGNLQSTPGGDIDNNSTYEKFLSSLQCNGESRDDSEASENGRWRKAHGKGAKIHTPSVSKIEIDVNNEINSSAVGDPIYSKDNPQVNFMSRRARVISVNRRHAFPPSKCPEGKMNGLTSMVGEDPGSVGNAWLSSYQVQNEGILSSGWVEKHSTLLPSTLLVVTTISEASIDECVVDRHVIQAVEDFRMTLSEKRSVPIHLVCLANCVTGGENSNRARDQSVAILKEKICEECYLPQGQVYLLSSQTDLEPDEFENAVLRSPYRSDTQVDATQDGGAKPVIMNPKLRQLDRSIRESSAAYYARLAEAQERKLSLWRNRYHSSNSSFEMNTLIAGIRCARYAMKVATLREFQMKTGATSTWTSVDENCERWTDKESLSMRFYEEAYRWVIEMHRRAVTWRATTNGSAGSDLMSPRNSALPNQVMSPNITQSPGGGFGVELPLPSTIPSEVPPPPMDISSPSTGTPEKVSGLTKDIEMYTNLWQQCRAVASFINSKLMCASSNSNRQDTINQWKRHRLIFLASPQGIRDYNPNQHDDFFGPPWYRMLFATEELRIYAGTVEQQLRYDLLISSKNGTTIQKQIFHQVASPWKIYSELAEALLGLGAELKKRKKDDSMAIDNENDLVGKFLGSNAAGDDRLKIEHQHDHKGIALEFILHALDLFDTAEKSAEPLLSIEEKKEVGASVRLHYLAGRLLMSTDDPAGGAVHLKIAAGMTKSWPSLQISIQRALRVCEERCLIIDDDPSSKTALIDDSKISSTKLLFQPNICALLTDKEINQAKSKALDVGCKEIVWKSDSSSKSTPPFDFALSFLKSTHANAGDTVMACLSLKSNIEFPLSASTIKLITSVGNFKASSTDLCFNKAQLHSWLKSSSTTSGGHSQFNLSNGLQLLENELAYIITEISIPSDFSSVALGETAIGNNFYTPKSGKLTNMGLTHAAGSICESLEEKLVPNGKPVSVSSLPESSASFLGGIPLVCYGVEMELGLQRENSDSSPLRLHVEKNRLLSPLGRSSAQQLQMEEFGYLAHAWSRPDHQLWCLGPRCLRVLGPRPQMEVTNLTDPHTKGVAVDGTINRIIFKLQAGTDVDCRGVRMSIRCRHSAGTLSSDDTTPVESSRQPVFVRRSKSDSTAESDLPLLKGWELRNDVSTNEANATASVISSHLEAGKSMLMPLDLFRPLSMNDNPSSSDTCTTFYEITITYRQVRAVKGSIQPNDLGDQVVVVRTGTIDWITPFSAEFSAINGAQKSFPNGIMHASNMVQPTSDNPDNPSPLTAADGERIRMRCNLTAKAHGGNVAAKIEYVTNENETCEEKKCLYSSSESSVFFAQSKHGSKLSLAYSVTARASTNDTHLGVLSIGWKPVGLNLSSKFSEDSQISLLDDFGLAHGPLVLSNIAPIKFYGPLCKVLDAPFKAKMLKHPSAPKVGIPFSVSYQVKNQTAKSQTLKLSLANTEGDGTNRSFNSQLLVTGKMQGNIQMAPWEEKVFSYTFMSMIAGKVTRPPLSVSSGRHQTWVINESNNMNSQTLFVMP